MNYRIASFFSGIGGLEAGLENSGLGHTVSQCEVNPYCRSVLARHWPGVQQYEDINAIPPQDLRALGGPGTVWCGGFPCQDVSSAGARKAIASSSFSRGSMGVCGSGLPPPR